MKLDFDELFASLANSQQMDGDKEPPSVVYHTVHANDQEAVNIRSLDCRRRLSTLVSKSTSVPERY